MKEAKRDAGKGSERTRHKTRESNRHNDETESARSTNDRVAETLRGKNAA